MFNLLLVCQTVQNWQMTILCESEHDDVAILRKIVPLDLTGLVTLFSVCFGSGGITTPLINTVLPLGTRAALPAFCCDRRPCSSSPRNLCTPSQQVGGGQGWRRPARRYASQGGSFVQLLLLLLEQAGERHWPPLRPCARRQQLRHHSRPLRCNQR